MGKNTKKEKGGRYTPPTPPVAPQPQSEGPQQIRIEVNLERQLNRVAMQRDALMHRNDFLETALEEKLEEIQQMRQELDELAIRIGGSSGQEEGDGNDANNAKKDPSGRRRADEVNGDGGGSEGRKHSSAHGKRDG